MSLLRPQPANPHGVSTIDAETPVESVVRRVLSGERLAVRDRYATAITAQAALRLALKPVGVDAGHKLRRAFRRRYREASDRLLVPMAKGQIQLSRAPSIGLLAELYPESMRRLLPVLDVQRLDKADQVYRQGVNLAVLGHPLHPFYGTYVPTRTEHLELFATWLAGWKGAHTRAIDVGTGSGVLALLMAKAGFGEVVATDTNPNAIHSVELELEKRPVPVRCVKGDLTARERGPFDVVAFNPPWLQGDVDELLDHALHYDDPVFFQRFFTQALAVLAPRGRVVVVFSDIGRLVQPDVPHPIEVELARGRFTLAQKLRRKVAGTKTEGVRRRTKERVEVWELARA